MAANPTQSGKGQKLHDLFREVFKLQAALSNVMDRVHEHAGLSSSQHRIIRALQDLGPATVPDLAARLEVSRQFVQTVCNRLSAMAFVEFTENPRHKRSRLVYLTDKGRSAFHQARQKENRTIENTLTGIDAGRAADALELLKQIRRTVQKHS